MPASKKIFEDKHFRTLIENSTDVIQLVGPHGDIIYCSDSIKSILGYTPKELVGVNVTPYLHADDAKRFTKRWQELIATPLAHDTIEYRIKHKNGEWVWVEANLTNHLDTPGINAIVGNFRNITERKQTEKRLRESERQFRLLSDHSPIAVTVHAEGKILYLNQAGAQMIGANHPDEVIGQPIARFVHPDYMAAVTERVKTIMLSGEPTPLFQEKFIRLDGGVIDVEVISLPITYDGRKAIQVVIRNITEQKKAASDLQESEERLRFMAESMPQKMFTTDARGYVDYVNPQWLDYSGRSSKELLAYGLRKIIHPDDVAATTEKWNHSLKTGEPFSDEVRFLRKDGVYRWHINRAQAMHDEKGNIIRWFGSNTDIDDIRAALKREHSLEKRTVRLKEQRSQLIALNKAKDEFIALASHQLRTPATAVKQFLGLLLQGYGGELSDVQHKMIASANDSNNRQVSIINDLLQVARLDGGKVNLNKQSIELSTVLQQAIEEMRGTLEERKQNIDFSSIKKPKKVEVDPIKIRMVLENILSNASKYSNEGKTIKAHVAYDNNQAHVIIQDEGVGISADNLDKLFKKFSRIDNPLSLSVGGSGLGLYWAQKIVELHGGSINVASEIEKGSTFTVSIPLK